jgi:hypothetical protein
MRIVVPLVFAASQKIERIVGPRLGLLGLYRGEGIPATKTFYGETVLTEMPLDVWADRSCEYGGRRLRRSNWNGCGFCAAVGLLF